MISGGQLLDALAVVFSVQGLATVMVGTLLAMLTSFLPGVGGTGIAILVMLATLHWSTEQALLLFSALTGGATFMGSITAILFRIPGNTPSAASLLDGYPLARQGYPRRAIACAATASAVGSMIGVVILLLILPAAASLLDSIGTFELLLIGLWGLLLIAALPGRRPVNGLTMALLGLVLASIGFDPSGESLRWTLGIEALESGIGLLPLLLGLFTLSEIVSWLRRYDLDSSGYQQAATDDRMLDGIRAVLRHWKLTLRSALTGTAVGIIPGIGGTAASFIAYAQAAARPVVAHNEAAYGEGNIRGLIAPEAAIDAKDGGSLLPAITLGLPGSEAGIVLIAVFVIHGIVPGASMLGSELHLTLLLIFGLLLSNLLTSLLGISLTPLLARLRALPVERLALPLLAVSLVAIVQVNGAVSDLAAAAAFGVLGFLLAACRWPVIPLVIGFTLGGFIETNLTLSIQLIEAGRIDPFARNGSLTLMALMLVSVIIYLYRYTRNRLLADRARDGIRDSLPDDYQVDDWIPALTVVVFSLVLAFDTLSAAGGGYSVYAVGILALLTIVAMASLVRSHLRRHSPGGGGCRTVGFGRQQNLSGLMLLLLVPVLVWLFGMVLGLAAIVLLRHFQLHRWQRLGHGLLVASVYGLLIWGYTELTAMYLPESALVGLLRDRAW